MSKTSLGLIVLVVAMCLSRVSTGQEKGDADRREHLLKAIEHLQAAGMHDDAIRLKFEAGRQEKAELNAYVNAIFGHAAEVSKAMAAIQNNVDRIRAEQAQRKPTLEWLKALERKIANDLAPVVLEIRDMTERAAKGDYSTAPQQDGKEAAKGVFNPYKRSDKAKPDSATKP